MKFKLPGITVEVVGDCGNTLSLVNSAIDRIENDSGFIRGMDECWVVFDKDDETENFDNAIKKAEAKGLKVAYSNESFELWFLLHFGLIDTAISREDYLSKLSERLVKTTGNPKCKYDKTVSIYGLIKDKEDDAIRNAKRLLGQYSPFVPYSRQNPSTTVHLLVEELNKLKK